MLVAAGYRRQNAPGPDVWAVANGQSIYRAEAEKYYSNRLKDQSQAQSAPQGQPQSQDEARAP